MRCVFGPLLGRWIPLICCACGDETLQLLLLLDFRSFVAGLAAGVSGAAVDFYSVQNNSINCNWFQVSNVEVFALWAGTHVNT